MSMHMELAPFVLRNVLTDLGDNQVSSLMVNSFEVVIEIVTSCNVGVIGVTYLGMAVHSNVDKSYCSVFRYVHDLLVV